MKKLFLIALLSLLAMPVVSFAAAKGTATFSCVDDGEYRYLTWAVTADADGNVDTPTITTAASPSCRGETHETKWKGVIYQAWIVPGTGNYAPSDQYDIELRPTGDATRDLLGGLGDNCSATNTKWGMPVDEVNAGVVLLKTEALTPYAANMGADAVNMNKFTLTIAVKKVK